MAWPRSTDHSAVNAEADVATIRAKALVFLTRREHARQELQQKLLQRGFPSDRIDIVLDELVQDRWLNERRYAEMYAMARAHKGYGPLRVAHELQMRGVPEAIVMETITDLAAEWISGLQAFHRKRFKTLPVDSIDTVARLEQTRFFYQRGFTTEQIQTLFSTL